MIASVAFALDRLARGGSDPNRQLVIITGRAKHSEGNVPIVKPEIEAMLEAEEYAGLGAGADPTNPGRLVIPAARLGAWIEERAAAASAPGVDLPS